MIQEMMCSSWGVAKESPEMKNDQRQTHSLKYPTIPPYFFFFYHDEYDDESGCCVCAA